MEQTPQDLVDKFMTEARREMSRKGGEARARKVQALKEAAAAGDEDAQREMRRIKRIARRNGRKGGRPKVKR